MNDRKLEDIKRQLAAVPALPGVYLWKDKKGRVIYVGKAKQLRARMRQYVDLPGITREKIPLLVSQIDSFEYIVVENEHESLVLEKNVIQQYYRPISTRTSRTTRAIRSSRLPPAMYFRLSNTRAKPITPTRAISVPILIPVPRATLSISRVVSCLSALLRVDGSRLKRRLENSHTTSSNSPTVRASMLMWDLVLVLVVARSIQRNTNFS